MKKIIIFITASLVILSAAGMLGGVLKTGKFSGKLKSKSSGELQFGDVVFQSSTSGQSLAIQLATDSKYSHVGMVIGFQNGDWQILEAVQPVRMNGLSLWRKGGDTEEIAVRRIIGADSLITDEVKDKMIREGTSYLGKDYDIYFDWSDEEIYCSELVWKIYHETLGIELGKLRPLKEFNLQSPEVKRIMKQRYGDSIPWESLMISPGDMYDSELFESVDFE
jgi:uncharacterized protein YycO